MEMSNYNKNKKIHDIKLIVMKAPRFAAEFISVVVSGAHDVDVSVELDVEHSVELLVED